MREKLEIFYSDYKCVYIDYNEYFLFRKFDEALESLKISSEWCLKHKISRLSLIKRASPYPKIHQYIDHLKSIILISTILPLLLILKLEKVCNYLINKFVTNARMRIALEILSVIIFSFSAVICKFISRTIVNTMSYAEAYIADFFFGGFCAEEPGYKRIKDSIVGFFGRVKYIDLNVTKTLKRMFSPMRKGVAYCAEFIKNFGLKCKDSAKFCLSYIPLVNRFVTVAKDDDIEMKEVSTHGTNDVKEDQKVTADNRTQLEQKSQDPRTGYSMNA